ncbi:MAG: hypothetical protein HY650_03645 [Acidobacteria bacterium]|nr:hypothetical protein [Acidobacteriota bacterium]
MKWIGLVVCLIALGALGGYAGVSGNSSETAQNQGIDQRDIFRQFLGSDGSQNRPTLSGASLQELLESNDEVWSFCYAKDKNLPDDLKVKFSYGSVWTWTAIGNLRRFKANTLLARGK